MTDDTLANPENHDDFTVESELDATAAELDPAEADTVISGDETDDLPVTPPDLRPRATSGDAGGDAAHAETIDERILQEEPEPNSAYGNPDDESHVDA